MSEPMTLEAAAGAAAGANREYLQVAVEHRVGDLLLGVDFSLSAPWTVLWGPSGAGKTSLLRALSGLARPERGRVVLRGQTLLQTDQGICLPAAQRGIGFVTQRTTLFPHMNVTANVAFGLAGFAPGPSAQRVGEMLELFRAAHLARRFPADLSGGELQRVALARALAPVPRLLLLDEPFTGLDADLKRSILGPLKTWLAQRAIPALYVSHDIAEAFEIADDVLLIDHGKIRAQGPAHVVLASRREQLLRQLGEG